MSAVLAAIILAGAGAAPAPVTIRCGAVERPGVALRDLDGVWRGRAVDLCAAAAKAAFGPAARVDFHGYESGLADAQADQIAFLSAAEMAADPVGGALKAGPVIAHETQILLVPMTSTFQRRADLAGHLVCFMVGSVAEDALDDWALHAAVPIERLGFQEPDEMHDAYAAGKCAAMAVDQAVEGSEPTVVPFASRALGAPLSQTPIFAALSVRTDPGWDATVTRITRWVLSS